MVSWESIDVEEDLPSQSLMDGNAERGLLVGRREADVGSIPDHGGWEGMGRGEEKWRMTRLIRTREHGPAAIVRRMFFIGWHAEAMP